MLKKEYIYTSTLPLGLHGLFEGDLYLFLTTSKLYASDGWYETSCTLSIHKYLVVTVQNLVARGTWRPGFANPCTKVFRDSCLHIVLRWKWRHRSKNKLCCHVLLYLLPRTTPTPWPLIPRFLSSVNHLPGCAILRSRKTLTAVRTWNVMLYCRHMIAGCKPAIYRVFHNFRA